MLDEQFSVINSSGQALLAAAVDSSGKADLSKLSKLQIPTTTAGEAKQTSLVELSLNLPADGNVITAEFNRNNPTTYNKSTALSVFDSGVTHTLPRSIIKRPRTPLQTLHSTNGKLMYLSETTQ